MTQFSMHDIAHVCHEANRAIQEITGDPQPSPIWDEAPDWQRDSAIEGVVKAVDGATPEMLHASWSESKIKDGWVYGRTKNPVAKTHPCLVHYEQLPLEQKVKDYVFNAIVLTMTRANNDEQRLGLVPPMTVSNFNDGGDY